MEQALNAIKAWHKEHLPDTFEAYRPGLSEAEILKTFEGISDTVPASFKTLYQWHDGLDMNAEFLPGFTFFPLEEALEEYKLSLEMAEQVQQSTPDIEDLQLWQASHWPVFGFQGDYYFIDLASGKDTVFYRPQEETQAFPWYSSLSQMMHTIASSLEIGAMHIDEDEIFAEEPEAVQAIRVRMNPGVAYFEMQAPEPQKREAFENEDGTKVLKTWYGEDHMVEEHYSAQGLKTGQTETLNGEVMRRDFWHYLSPQEVEITSEHYMGMMMTTKTLAHIDDQGQVHSKKMQTFVNDVMISEQEFDLE